MASKTVFGSSTKGSSNVGPATDTRNLAGGRAYSLSAKEALAQLAATGCFNQTFYASAQDQLGKVTELAGQVDPKFVAQVAIYARGKGFMKDMPAFLLAFLSGKLTAAAKAEEAAHKAGQKDQAREHGAEVQQLSRILTAAFPRVIDNGKMLRNFVQIVRSGTTGRKSLGSAPRRLVTSWLEGRTPEQLFLASVGNDPSLGDILSLVHPAPADVARAAIYGYLLGKEKAKHGETGEFSVLTYCPDMVREYEAFKADTSRPLPKAPYEMLEGLALSKEQWVEIATERSSWQQVRQHLSTFGRKGVFESDEAVKKIAAKLADRDQIKRARVMPYQLLVAYLNAEAVPAAIRNALQDAVEIATENIPVINGRVAVFPDVSGSMRSPVTGTKFNPKTGKVESHTTKVSCLDVAALVAASILRKNPEALILPFAETSRTGHKFNPRDSIMTNAEALKRVPGGGTNCSAPMATINQMKYTPDLVWYVSDNESWVDSGRTWSTAPTATLAEWDKVKQRNPGAKLVCMDLTPNTTSQAPSRAEIMNIGGFSDVVFEAVAAFTGGLAGSWIEMIENAVGDLG